MFALGSVQSNRDLFAQASGFENVLTGNRRRVARFYCSVKRIKQFDQTGIAALTTHCTSAQSGRRTKD
jgi:hypothetical protein